MALAAQKRVISFTHLKALICLSFGIFILLIFSSADKNTSTTHNHDNALLKPKNLNNSEFNVQKKRHEIVEFEQDKPENNQSVLEIKKGDTLSRLFDELNLSQTTLVHLLSADESLLALETLKPGHKLFFTIDHNSQLLQKMTLFVHPGHQVIYRRTDTNLFEYETVIKEGQWRTEMVHGEISGSFYLSAQRAGLTNAEAATVTQIFKEQLDFARVIRKGDKFQVVRQVQFVDEVATGQTRIESARVQRRNVEHTAFLFDDGRYYDKDGNSLARAFKRIPLARNYRISSHFNPKRVHPVTGRVRPHNGTDFATPTGTKVLSTGDGVVTRVGNHRFAGRYVDIKHGAHYKTRYLHLHRVLVRKGQTVTRGQTVALSGNTGRSTGPHLHFELHINGRPVNPMKADIPLSHSISKKDHALFFVKVSKQTRLLNNFNDPLDETQSTQLAD